MARHNAEPVRAPFERPVTPQLKGVRSGPLDQDVWSRAAYWHHTSLSLTPSRCSIPITEYLGRVLDNASKAFGQGTSCRTATTPSWRPRE